MTTHTAHVMINASADKVFDVASDYSQVTKWAKNFILGLSGSPSKGYVAQTPMGPMKYEIRANRALGVVDQFLDGRPLPARVVPLGDVSLFTFTLLLPPDMPEAEVKRSIAGLEEELLHLKRLVESS